MFDLFNIQILDSIIVTTKKYYLLSYISIYTLNEYIYNLIIFIFKYTIGGFLVILFLLFQKLKKSCIKYIFGLINKITIYN